jgi:hypothetical protein
VLHRFLMPFLLGDLMNVLIVTGCVLSKGNSLATLIDTTSVLSRVELAKDSFGAAGALPFHVVGRLFVGKFCSACRLHCSGMGVIRIRLRRRFERKLANARIERRSVTWVVNNTYSDDNCFA